jgi:phosphoserine phosphatase
MTSRYRLVLFDVDSTLIQQEVIDVLASRTEHGSEVADITRRAMAGELDFDGALRERVSLLEGLPESILTFSPGALDLISELQQRHIRVGAVSGGFINVLQPLFAELKLDFLLANTLEVSGGSLTGKVLGPIVNRLKKKESLVNFAETFSIDLSDTIAVGDGANDLDMIKAAGLGVSYRGKAILNDAADVVITEPGLDQLLNYL